MRNLLGPWIVSARGAQPLPVSVPLRRNSIDEPPQTLGSDGGANRAALLRCTRTTTGIPKEREELGVDGKPGHSRPRLTGVD
jgi:hypothetical protein